MGERHMTATCSGPRSWMLSLSRAAQLLMVRCTTGPCAPPNGTDSALRRPLLNTQLCIRERRQGHMLTCAPLACAILLQ